MKKSVKNLLFISLIIIIILSFCGCSHDSGYLKKLDDYGIWDNSVKTAIPQTAIANIVEEHMENNNGKDKKVAILGLDGVRTDGLINVFDCGVKYSGKTISSSSSAMNFLVENGGGAYISFAGGEKNKESQQKTSTAPGWCSIATGVWGNKNGVLKNGQSKNLDYKTFMLKYSEKTAYGASPIKSCFINLWDPHFDIVYKKEIDFLNKNQEIDMEYINTENDNDLQEILLELVEVGNSKEKDMIFAVYDNPDANGHNNKFSNKNHGYVSSIKNCDNLAYEVIQKIYQRQTFNNEDWAYYNDN